MLRLNSSRIDHPFNKDAKDEKDMKRERGKEKEDAAAPNCAAEHFKRPKSVCLSERPVERNCI